jgi:hypothetical protein
VKYCVLFAALLLAPCLYSQESLTFGDPAFGGLFRVPNFETPRLTNFADGSGPYGAETESPEKAVSLTPLWLKDLRRAEIVAFGSFPLTMFWTTFFMDLYRTASHGWDNRYAPWPFKGAGAIEMTDQEVVAMFSIAISSSLVIATMDHFIMRYRRSRAGGSEKPVRLDKMPQEPPAPPPIIIPGD